MRSKRGRSIRHSVRAGLVLAVVAGVLRPMPVGAKGADNALASADDAFGTTVGKETSGIYTDKDTRGFNPIDAGNARIDGLYYDPVGLLGGRLRASTAIRVGFGALAFPFSAPTGVADYRFRPFPETAGGSISVRAGSLWDRYMETDLRLPLADGRLGLTGGFTLAGNRKSTGFRNNGSNATIRPIARLGSLEFAPFLSLVWSNADFTEPLAVVDGPWLPGQPSRTHRLGQQWTGGKRTMRHYGATLKASVADRLRLEAGLFHSGELKQKSFTEIFDIQNGDSLADHFVIADPEHDIHSTSGEGRWSWQLGGGEPNHRIVLGARFRNRYTESGGSDIRSFGQVRYGERVLVAEPELKFSPIARGRVRQSAVMLGYLGDFGGIGHMNLGVQRATYRSTLRAGAGGAADQTRTRAWLYNAVATIKLSRTISLYAGTERGLEDSGAAPETARNRHEQLPATITRQIEGGLRWSFSGGALVVSGFEITKPYFTYDLARNYARLGRARLLGLEASVSAHPLPGLSLLAGGVVMQARVAGDGVESGQIGVHPAGKAGFRARLDGSYRTPFLGGFEPTLAIAYTGRRAAGSAPQAALGGHQLMAPGFATVDLGFRQPLAMGPVSASLRLNLENAFDAKGWKVVAPNTIYPEERRRVMVTLFSEI